MEGNVERLFSGKLIDSWTPDGLSRTTITKANTEPAKVSLERLLSHKEGAIR